MSKGNLSAILKTTQAAIAKHSPEILTGVGIAGMITSAALAVRATPKALTLIEERHADLGLEQGEKLPPAEVVKTTWKCYIPAVLTGLTSAACLIGANSVHARRTAALATAYKLSETALTEYQERVIEEVGEKKERIIRDKVAEKCIKNDPVTNHEVIVTGKGSTLCYDGTFGRYFRSDIDTIRKAVNKVNRDLVTDMYVSLNEFYDEIGLSHTKIGDDLGWNFDDGQIDVDFSSQLAEDGTPCLVIRYTIAPKYDYSRFM
jgi:hypothetical protein